MYPGAISRIIIIAIQSPTISDHADNRAFFMLKIGFGVL